AASQRLQLYSLFDRLARWIAPRSTQSRNPEYRGVPFARLARLSTLLHYSSNVLSSVAKNARHPDQFIQEFVESPHITLIEQIPIFVENILHFIKIHVPKDCYQAKLAHDWQEALKHTLYVKRTRRDTANPHGFVIVLLEDSCQGR